MAESERVQKILAKAGIASRRKCEALIAEGSVTINGQTAKLGDKAQYGKDAIKVNGKLLRGVEAKVYLAFYKPRAVISMLVDNENRPSLSDYLTKVSARVFPIGRLDFNSEGLIILTNDGDYAEKMQKRDDIPRVYTVKVKGHAGPDAIKRLEKGARLDYRMVRPHSVRLLRELDAKSELQIVIMGGGAVDIRALCEMKGLLVDKITRTAIGHLTLRGLVPGHFRLLKASQAEAILEQPELGLKLLSDEIEAEKPKGQRNYHDKKAENEPAVVTRAAAPVTKPAASTPVKVRTSAPRPSAGPAPAKARFGSGDKPRFGSGDKPRFGSGDKPRFGSGDKPRFGSGDKPRFGSGDKPRFGSGDKPRFGSGDKPRFGSGDKPRFGSGDKPRFGAPKVSPDSKDSRESRPERPKKTRDTRSAVAKSRASDARARGGYGIFKPGRSKD